MTENSSNSDLDKEDSFTNLSDEQISLLDECVNSTTSTSTQQLIDANSFNVEEIKKKFENEMNVLIEAKIEAKNGCLENEIKALKNDANIVNDHIVDIYKEIDDLNLKMDKLNNIEDNKKDVELGYDEKQLKEGKVLTNEDFVALVNKIDELTFELKQLKEGKGVCFLYVPNKWKFIDSYWACCEKKCVNTDKPNGFCFNGNGFIQLKSDTDIKYINYRKEFESNKLAEIKAESPFYKPNELNCSTYTLFYYEVKVQFEKNSAIAIGLTGEHTVALWAYSKLIFYKYHGESKQIDFPSFSFKNEDIIGCGLVYPPPKLNNKLPYVFFTQNGKQIGKAVLLKENCLTLRPFLQLKGHSVETNFGEDLTSNPFIYNISKHYVAEEFYKEEEIFDYKK